MEVRAVNLDVNSLIDRFNKIIKACIDAVIRYDETMEALKLFADIFTEDKKDFPLSGAGTSISKTDLEIFQPIVQILNF